MRETSDIFKIVLICLFLYLPVYSQLPNKTLLFVGSYTNGEKGEGIHVYSFDSKEGTLSLLHTEAGLINSSFLAVSPSGKQLYVATDTQIENEGTVSAFEIDPILGKLTFLNKQLAGGRNPVHINIHPSGKFLINSNYTDAGISLFPINEDGTIDAYSQLFTFSGSSILKPRQNEAHVHSSNFSLDGKFLFAMDLGTDKIYRFKVEQSGNETSTLTQLESVIASLGSGPRHFAFHPSGKFGFAVNELNGSVTGYHYQNGELLFLQNISCYGEGVKVFQSADVHCSPDGKFLYVSNRGSEENSMVIFSINQKGGKLSLVGRTSTYGEHPRSFVIAPDGQYLIVANQFTNNLVVFKRDSNTGLLTKTKTELKLDAPASLKMVSYKTLK